MERPEFFAAHPGRRLRYAKMAGQLLLVDGTRGNARPLVPPTLSLEIVTRFHRQAHAGVKATRRAVEAWYLVPGVATMAKQVVKDSRECQVGRPSPREKPPRKQFDPPLGKFLDLHVDFVVLPPARGRRYLLSRQPGYPLATSTTEETVEAFLAGWVARYGVPRSIVSDQGPQFVSTLWRGVCRGLGVEHRLAPAYHPATNGLVERWHRDLKQALAARLARRDWV